jgi:SAM-dependent methyltransferase
MARRTGAALSSVYGYRETTMATTALSERARRLIVASQSGHTPGPVDSQVGVGTARKGARQRAWAFATSFVRNRPRVRSMIDIARFLAKSARGDVCRCTLCGVTGRFLPFGMPPRINAACPGCGSLERHRLFGLYLQREPAVVAGKLVLHFAPERPVAAAVRAASPELYRSADIEVGRADLQLSLEKIDLPDQSVDVVIASHILEHVDDRLALPELRRVLSPGGRAIIMVPIVEGWDETYENGAVRTNAERARHFGQEDHVRMYGRDLRERIVASGFELSEFTATAQDCLAHGLMRGEKIFVARRPL